MTMAQNRSLLLVLDTVCTVAITDHAQARCKDIPKRVVINTNMTQIYKS